MDRRTLISTLAGGAAALAGCPGGNEGAGTATPATPDLPADCPTSQGLDVDWPAALDAAAVRSFVAAYEHAYYRTAVVEYDPETRLASYQLRGRVAEGPRELGDGWALTYSGGGAIYRPTLALGATTATPPAGADVVSVADVESVRVVDTLREAADTGEAEHHVDPPGETVDDHVDMVASRSADFEPLTGRSDADTLYVDVDGTTVKLDVLATNHHGDHRWEARYHVTDHVVRRTSDGDTDARDGRLLECRRSA